VEKLLGAIVGGEISPEVRDYAYNSGVFVLKLSGSNSVLIPPPKDFSLKIWLEPASVS
jgi:hypothetical protein